MINIKNKHKLSTIVLIFFLTIIGVFVLVSAIQSEDIDEICATDGRLLFRNNGTWQCGQLAPDDFNITYTYNINYTNNTYIRINESDPTWNTEKEQYIKNNTEKNYHFYGDSTVTETITIRAPSQDYIFTSTLGGTRSTLALQSLTTGQPAYLEIFNTPGDDSQVSSLRLFSLGTPNQLTNTEFLEFIDSINYSGIQSRATGTGEARTLRIGTADNEKQIVLGTDNKVNISQTAIIEHTGSAAILGIDRNDGKTLQLLCGAGSCLMDIDNTAPFNLRHRAPEDLRGYTGVGTLRMAMDTSGNFDYQSGDIETDGTIKAYGTDGVDYGAGGITAKITSQQQTGGTYKNGHAVEIVTGGLADGIPPFGIYSTEETDPLFEFLGGRGRLAVRNYAAGGTTPAFNFTDLGESGADIMFVGDTFGKLWSIDGLGDHYFNDKDLYDIDKTNTNSIDIEQHTIYQDGSSNLIIEPTHSLNTRIYFKTNDLFPDTSSAAFLNNAGGVGLLFGKSTSYFTGGVHTTNDSDSSITALRVREDGSLTNIGRNAKFYLDGANQTTVNKYDLEVEGYAKFDTILGGFSSDEEITGAAFLTMPSANINYNFTFLNISNVQVGNGTHYIVDRDEGSITFNNTDAEGIYGVWFGISFQATRNGIYHCGVYKNEVKQEISIERNIGTAGTVGNAKDYGHVQIVKGDRLNVQCDTSSGSAPVLEADHFTFKFERVSR